MVPSPSPAQPKFVLGKTGNTEISFHFNGNFDPEKGLLQKRNFKDVTMRFGNTIVQGNHLFVSMNQDGNFYLVKSVGGWFVLSNGKRGRNAEDLIKREGRGLPTVKLEWAKYGNNYNYYWSRLSPETCTFSPLKSDIPENWKIIISCDQYKNQRTQTSWPKATKILSKSDYKI